MYDGVGIHLEIHTDTRRRTPYHYGLFRQSFRREGRVCKRTRGRVTGLGLPQLKALRAFLQKGCPDLEGACGQVLGSREYGASAAVLGLARELGLDRMLYSRNETWVRHILAMVVGRLVYQGSKLSLVNRWRDTALWDLVGLGGARPDVDLCYEAMDDLLARQEAIQKKLAAGRLRDGCLILYDVTSSYMEGEYAASDLVAYGHNRDGKRGHEQIVIGLMTDKEGCPVGAEVYPGNTADQTTVMDRVAELKGRYGLSDLVLAGDRGMLTAARLKDVSQAGLKTITALTHPQMQALLSRGVIQLGLFDERDIAEVVDPEHPEVRYMLCKNPETAEREGRTRAALLGKTVEALQKLQARKRPIAEEDLAAKVGEVLGKWKMKKFLTWGIREGRLHYEVEEAKVKSEEALDGCYVVRTDVGGEKLSKGEAVASYRRLAKVEAAIRQLKTVQLEVRPVYHHKDERIRAHVFLCVLAYWLEWHLLERLRPLFEEDGEGKDRRWTLEGVLERLKAIRVERTRYLDIECELLTVPDVEQQRLLDLIGVPLEGPTGKDV